jgi:uncharacterized protein
MNGGPRSSGPDRPSRAAVLSKAIEHAGNLLPAQGPITAFAFLNTLQALEDLPVDDGLRKGGRLFGCQPYMTEDRYRERVAADRIRGEDLAAVLREDLGDHADAQLSTLDTRFALRLAMLQFPLRTGPAEELRWFVAETDSLTRMRAEAPPPARARFLAETREWVLRALGARAAAGTQVGAAAFDDPRGDGLRGDGSRAGAARLIVADLVERFDTSSVDDWSHPTWEAVSLQALWRVCREGVHGIENFAPPPPAAVRHRDLLLEATGQNSDALVHELLIRFCAAFTDQGLAHWHLPNRELGFFKSFCALYGQPGGSPDRWMQGLPQELNRLTAVGVSPPDSVLESLNLLDVPESEWDDFVPATILALRGWAGILHQNDIRGDRVARPSPPNSLVELLAVRLVLERWALAFVAREWLSFDRPLARLRSAAATAIGRHEPPGVEQRAFLVFQLAQILGWSPARLHGLSKRQWSGLMAEIEAFSGLERRRMFQAAFEHRLRTQALDAVSAYCGRQTSRVVEPRFQAVFCIDAREESFRRHLEEVAPDTETFGAPGFFGVPIYYRGVADANFDALCPIVIRPKHWVVEEVVYSLEETNRRRAMTRRLLGTTSHHMHVGSRSITGGALLTAGVGVLASIPLVTRVLFPLVTARIRHTAGQFVQPPPVTRLVLERTAATPGPAGDQVGFTVDEMAAMGERMLRDIGLTSGFARLVMFFGHGSFCLNNPHKSVYDCGACSGSPGAPNARALAAILNDPRVREILAARGLMVPDETVFIGGLHNTAVDSLTFFDLDLLPKSHIPDFEGAKERLELACERNAHERCRRFESAPLALSFSAARRHVEGRSQDLAQTRPEYGNASNAMCFVGRRDRVRGLYLDRRSFLTSYDPLQDDAQCTILARILAAAVPVCEGINMQYFLSYTDSPGWGCGTKLPHNVTALLGVMDGAASDLRCGLPWQGVDIHEPVRLLFVIESTPAGMEQIIAGNEVVGRILRNGWAQLALLDPHSSEIQVYRNKKFYPYRPETADLPRASSSFEWYRNVRDHLGFAAIGNRNADSSSNGAG